MMDKENTPITHNLNQSPNLAADSVLSGRSGQSEPASLNSHIFLIGFMGTGKSTVATQLRKMISAKQMEMDETIAREEGMSISDIFASHGEAYFRDLETALVRRLMTEAPMIVSCGGGAVMREENTQMMKQCGQIVLLTATPETVYERVKDNTDRPILNNNMNVEYIRSLMEKRRSRYESVADITIATDGKNAKAICQELLDALKRTHTL